MSNGVTPFRGLLRDLFILLAYAYRGELVVSSRGCLQQNKIKKVTDSLQVSSTILRQTKLTYTFCDRYEPQLALALDAAIFLGLLTSDLKRYLIQVDCLMEWLSLPEQEQSLQLYTYWKQVHDPQDEKTQLFVKIIEEIPHGNEVSLHDLINDLEDDALLTDEWLQHMQNIWIAPLCALGWLEQREVSSDNLYLCSFLPKSNPIEVASSPLPSLYVQPDYEIIVLPHASFATRWQAMQFTANWIWDEVTTLQLTSQSVSAALDNGQTYESIRGFMNEHSIHEIPDHVLDMMERWANREMMRSEQKSMSQAGTGVCTSVECDPPRRIMLIRQNVAVLGDFDPV
ncbi:helicase-associated domain-containing protein [Paenibacillus sp. N1-5-1-14]|uniref:helicase-associated domain-containing protein n=1 Tax=Paenibacillus radicibacter TaxID=2972488 RepID=UPI002159032D|nr:helicase-associated domain-containing protein [Paenibacillus radicibacter]MCR8641736.1 helicase-associated domain-containing protein [Paenibacillus radicibacter]